MDLRTLTKNARSAARARARLLRDGVTPSGHKVWTDEEDLACRLFYPDYFALSRILPHRSPVAVRQRCGRLGLVRRYASWPAIERQKLRRLYPSATREEICAAFPGVSWVNICSAARRYGYKRNRKPYKITGVVALDQVRARCFEIKWIMRDLDEEARTKRYFQKRGSASRWPNFQAIRRAVVVLGGDFEVRWSDEPDNSR